MKKSCLLPIFLLSVFTPLAQNKLEKVPSSRCHAFVDDENIWTLEVVESSPGQFTPIMNIITLGEDELSFEPSQIHISNARGKTAKIDKFSIDTGVSDEPYVTSTLKILERSFIGLDLLGDFKDFAEPAQVVVELGNSDFTLEPLACLDYEMLAEKIDKININTPNIREDYRVLQIDSVGKKGPRKKGRR